MSVPSELAAQILAKCGRRCCVCRRFLPVRLQVHHIVPKSEGGTDDMKNLIALCLTCHTDVHSEVPFTRRFTPNELKMHRDELFKLIAAGSLSSPAQEHVPLEPVTRSGFQAVLRRHFPDYLDIMPAAALILVVAVREDGRILFMESDQGAAIRSGKTNLLEAGSSRRDVAEYRAAIEQLVSFGLLRHKGVKGQVFELTYEGYLFADEIMVAQQRSSDSDNEA